jgi:hypothetical protein
MVNQSRCGRSAVIRDVEMKVVVIGTNGYMGSRLIRRGALKSLQMVEAELPMAKVKQRMRWR